MRVVGIDVSTLEPAERDPAKLRKTAFLMLSVAFVGAFIVIKAYRLKTEDESGRPAVVTRLESNFAAVNQEGEGVDIGQLEGKVWLATTIALSRPEIFADSIKVMKEIEAEYTEDQVVKFVCLTVDPENDRPEKLKEYADVNGLGSERWWFLAASEDLIRGYVRDEMRLGSVSIVEEGSEERIDFHSIIGVYDQHRHLRGDQFDFKQAREVAESAQKFMETEPENAEKMFKEIGVKPQEHVDDYEERLKELRETIDFLLTEDLTEQ